MGPRLRKLALTTHVATSVGWFGAVATFLVLAMAGLTSANEMTVRSAYLAMEITGAGLRMQLVADAIAASVALLAATAFSIYKPWGLTPYGARALRRETGSTSEGSGMPAALKTALVAGAVLLVVIVLHHLFGRAGH